MICGRPAVVTDPGVYILWLADGRAEAAEYTTEGQWGENREGQWGENRYLASKAKFAQGPFSPPPMDHESREVTDVD